MYINYIYLYLYRLIYLFWFYQKHEKTLVLIQNINIFLKKPATVTEARRKD